MYYQNDSDSLTAKMISIYMYINNYLNIYNYYISLPLREICPVFTHCVAQSDMEDGGYDVGNMLKTEFEMCLNHQ